ncbi:hypothetical protein SDD30_01360 [Moorella naiadis]
MREKAAQNILLKNGSVYLPTPKPGYAGDYPEAAPASRLLPFGVKVQHNAGRYF